MHITNIEWDTEVDGQRPSPEDLGLPIEVFIPKEELVEKDDIADYLSDTYGYCVFSFLIKEEEEIV